jgi:hypothetical protein
VAWAMALVGENPRGLSNFIKFSIKMKKYALHVSNIDKC